MSLTVTTSSFSFVSTTEPRTYLEASKYSVWKQAMKEKIDALIRQGTWELVLPPPQANIIGCQWIYKIKRHFDGSTARY